MTSAARAIGGAMAVLLAIAPVHRAEANGRTPATLSIAFREGQETEIAVAATFGLLRSHDGGASWEWMCDQAIGNREQAPYDPHLAYSSSGALFISTLIGLKVMRDACTLGSTPTGTTLVSLGLLAPGNGGLYFAASQEADANHGVAEDFAIYRSTDDGATITPLAGQPAGPVSWWQSLRVAPSDPQRLYLSGFDFASVAGGQTRIDHLLYRSDNGGADWVALPAEMLSPMPNSQIDIVGISRNNPDHVYARVSFADNRLTASIYRSSDAGATWTLINNKGTTINAFLARSNGDLIVGTAALGAEISRDNGDSWTPLAGAPHMGCLVENAAGELWACTQNYGSPTIPSDEAALMKTTDLVTWTKVLQFQDLTRVVACDAGTTQRDTCQPLWCGACVQLGCEPAAMYGCEAAPADTAPIPPRPPSSGSGGCCDGGAGSGLVAIGLAVGTLVWWPRRRRPIHPTARRVA